jgi:hypothetical protein
LGEGIVRIISDKMSTVAQRQSGEKWENKWNREDSGSLPTSGNLFKKNVDPWNWHQDPILPNMIIPILHICVKFSYKYV